MSQSNTCLYIYFRLILVMTKNDLKRERVLFDDGNQTRTDAKKIKLENVHERERIGVHTNCHNVKGFSFVENCRDLAHQDKAKQIALKQMKTINDCSSPGINCYFFVYFEVL